VKERVQACKNLSAAVVQAAYQCDLQTKALFPERSASVNARFVRRVRFFAEFLSFFVSAVDRAANFKGLAEEQREEIHQRIVPDIIEGTIDIFAPGSSPALREKLRSESCFDVNFRESEYSALVGVSIYHKLAENIENSAGAAHQPAIARKVALITREQLQDKFAQLVDAVVETF
jgi:hypothetical protein